MANVVMILLLAALIGSGIGLVLVSGGQAFVWYDRVHRWATYLLTPVILGHIIIAAGILPGYRGVWRAMHLGGRLRRQDAGRVWPGWLERTTAEVSIDTEAADGPQEAGTAAESTDTPPEARDVSAPTPPGPRHRARRRTDETGSE
jgi:formate dehydrogenase subunit gamma